MPVFLAIVGAPIFGWAKPVPVNIGRLRHPRNQAVLVGLVGPATNIILATIAGVVLHLIVLAHPLPVTCSGFVCAYDPQNFGLGVQFLFFFGIVNIVLAVFNLIPIPPLDGSALLERLIPVSLIEGYYRIRTGLLVLVMLFIFADQGLLGHLLGNVENWYFNLIV